jgi:hypothetical protein
MCIKIDKCHNASEECSDPNNIDCGCFCNPELKPQTNAVFKSSSTALLECLGQYLHNVSATIKAYGQCKVSDSGRYSDMMDREYAIKQLNKSECALSDELAEFLKAL